MSPPGAAAEESMVFREESLRDQAARIIRGEIISGALEAGKVYSARAIALRLGVSPTPVREAMIDLGKDGLLTPVRNRGFEVRRLDDRDLDEVFELRLMLEVPASRKAAALITPARAQVLRELATGINERAEAGDLAGFLDSDRQFHLGIVDLLGNTRLTAIVGQLRDQSRLYALRKLTHDELMASAREHYAILDALTGGDGPTAADLTTLHLRHTRGNWAGLPE
jgi:DNA-binding GntR family transcriptional regulator